MSRPVVTWFANNHEHSLHYAKFGLMAMARAGEIRFLECPNATASADLLPEAVRCHQHRRTVAVRITHGASSRLVILDGEDSIFQTSPLIEHCDLYFSCSYRRKFFEGAPFDLTLPWQTDCELAHYQKKYTDLQNQFGTHLCKGRAFVPIGPNLEWERPNGFFKAKTLALRHRLSQLRAPWIDWGVQCDRFERRWAHLHTLRSQQPVHDVVLKDSLWGWPRHRVALHRQLAELSADFSIRAELHYRVAAPCELGTHPAPDPADFPMTTGGGVTGDYESLLAASRLGVFATGFHYGCRNIVTLSWFLGLRTLVDPPSFEAIYDFTEVGARPHISGSWAELPTELRAAREETPNTRRARQQRFDEVASPSCAARHLIEQALA